MKMKNKSLNFEELENKYLLNTDYTSALISSEQLKQIEYLDRGVNVSYLGANKGAYVNWRLLGTDVKDVSFNVYKSINNSSPVKINSIPITKTTDYIDKNIDISKNNVYTVKPIIDNIESNNGSQTLLSANPNTNQYKSIPLRTPVGGTTPDGVSYTYSANDVSVGDVDGDGQYEIIVKWDPSNSKDNSQSGYTGNVYIDAYKLNGTFLWRIDLGKNIRAGAHYTQFIVYDLDGDGKAEVAMKTAPGTIDGIGKAVLLGNDSSNTDYRNSSGYILSGPEYLTIFEGSTGKNLTTIYYNPSRGNVSSWGDSYGNRVDRFLAGVGYFDGNRPSLLMCRGYYTRTVLVAYDYRDNKLSQRWIFDTNSSSALSSYRGQGSHSLNIADVDRDGKDEVIYGAMTIDHDGKPLYNTTWGHGDALHTADMSPDNLGLEIFMVHETESLHKGNGGTLVDAATGKLLASIPGVGDVGRGIAMDIDPRYPGYEMWTIQSALYSSNGQKIQDSRPSFVNMGIWWDGDPLKELFDGTTIGDWVIGSDGIGYRTNLVYAPAGLTSNNSTKATPCLIADLYGDWREEVIWRNTNSTELQIWSTIIPSQMKLVTLMHDIQYRESIAWQNVGYNQPPNTSYFIGQNMIIPDPPKIYTVKWGSETTIRFDLLIRNPSVDIKNSMIYVTPNSFSMQSVRDNIISNKIWSSYFYNNNQLRIGYKINQDDTLILSAAIEGDTNLDGNIDILDVLNISSSMRYDSNLKADWSDGDFNYDGIVDILDLVYIFSFDLYDTGSYKDKTRSLF